MKTQDQYFSLTSLSEYTDTPIPTLRDYIKACGLPCFKVRGKLSIRRSEFDAWMEGFRVKHDSLSNIVDDVMEGLASDR